MEKKEEKSGSEAGGSSGCCGSGSGKWRCCPGSLALILVVALAAALVGYGLGKCGKGKMCGMSGMMNCPVSGSQTPGTPTVK